MVNQILVCINYYMNTDEVLSNGTFNDILKTLNVLSLPIPHRCSMLSGSCIAH